MNPHVLNFDIFCEMLPHFVAVDPEGPFTLMLVCTASQDMVLNHPLLWSWVHMDAELGDLEARMAVCTSLSANQPIYLNLYIPYPPSFIGFIRPHIHRIHSVVVHMPMDLKMNEAVDQVSKMVRSLHLNHLSFRFLRGGQDVFYSPFNMNEMKHSLYHRFDSPTCPSNMITALTFNPQVYGLGKLSIRALLTWLSLNVHLVHLEIDTGQFTMKGKEALPIVSLPSLLALNIRSEFRNLTAILLRHIQSPNSIAITLSGYSESVFSAISNIGVGLQPSAMTIILRTGGLGLPTERSETIKKGLSSLRYLHLHLPNASLATARSNEFVQCLPGSTAVRITSGPYSDKIVSLIDQPPHLIQLEYTSYLSSATPDAPSVPAWCRNAHPFDTLSLNGYTISLIASFCKKLFLIGDRTSTSLLNSKINLHIEELKCGGEVYDEIKRFPPKVGELNNLSKLTCTLSFALALLQQRRLPMLRELILINNPARSRPTYDTFKDKWESFSSLLTKTSPTRAQMRLLSIPVWTPWVPLFDIAMLLSRGNESGIIPTLVLRSFPHPRILGQLVDCLNGEIVTQMDDLPSWKSPKRCEIEDICYECHNGGWWCADVQRCRRGQRGEPVSITRYTLSN